MKEDLRLFIVLSRAYKFIMEHALRDMRKHGLNPTEFMVLELLYHKGPTPLQQIGDRILLASGSMTYVVDRLVQKGYLKRQHCEKDRRVIYGVLTEKGKELFDEIFPQHEEAIRNALAGLDEEEKAQAIDLLKRLGLEAQKRLT
ncbi:MAG TPA: MarR family transcriptional regulator [Paenibacillaceae bacterium]|nr:MarR family transcriptional regulator [Paenibacillaceae bacterium]